MPRTFHKFKRVWRKYGLDWKINDFKLTRLDLCYNIVFPHGNENTVPYYIDTLRRTLRDREYTCKMYEEPERQRHQVSLENTFRALTVYDKNYQQLLYESTDFPAPAIMRVELQLKRRNIREKWECGSKSTKKLIQALLDEAPVLFLYEVQAVFRPQVYASMKEIERRIQESGLVYGKTKVRMLSLSHKLEECCDGKQAREAFLHGIGGSGKQAQKIFETVKNGFDLLQVSPTPLKGNLEFLPSLPQITAVACNLYRKTPTGW